MPPSADTTPEERLESVRERPLTLVRSPRIRARMAPVEGRPPLAALDRDAIYRRLLALADLLAVTVALVLATSLSSPAHLTIQSALILPLAVVAVKVLGLYERDELLLRKTTLDETPALFGVATLFALGTWLLAPALLDGELVRSDVVLLWAAIFGLMLGLRAGARVAARVLTPVERCLFLGELSSAERFRSKLGHGGGTKASVVAQFELEDAQEWATPELSSTQLASLREVISDLNVHRVVLAPRTGDAAETLDLVRALKAVGARVSVLPDLFEVIGSSVEFDDLHGMTLLGVRRFELTRSSLLVKRGFDVVAAMLGLIIASPVLIVFALLIRLNSAGGAFFCQERIGRDGKPFRMVKFRTMVRGADESKAELFDLNEGADGFFKIDADPRVTGVGRFLRETSLDELPQLLNVLRGEMSLVGPRPLIHEEDRLISGWQRRRLELKPGMTGHWQILGSSRVPLAEMVTIDYLYVANWSLWSDLKILLRTVPYVLARGSR